MPLIVSYLLGGLLQIAGSLVGRVLLALGFGFVEYVGISTLLDNVKQQATGLIGAVGASSLAEWAGFFRVDVHLSIILSAIGVKVMLNALGGDKVRRLVQR
ncbi:cobalt ABC transporter permease [Delftia tsuruhatensis]|jgi:hypothetical protein|uniref:DUF2523 domain-containing protein n=1 Tax=uncultured Delftia sp. TaxID=191464 RepID=UPI0004D6C3E2|nr:DUF2523 domain-containing protein [uncultured Delftia sp.]KEH07581.1 cobalt ABC transporter permease [Delftia tsuruhatensis]